MLSRRDFLNGTVGAGLALTTQAAQPASAQAPAPQPARRRADIVDSQVHLWLAQTPDRPWPADGPARAHLPYPFTYDKLLPMMDEAGVDRVVIVPPSWEGERNDYALEAARKYPNRFAVMGRILLGSKQAPGLLATWRDQPGMLGVRHTFNGAQTSWLTDGTADWFWPAAAKAGHSGDDADRRSGAGFPAYRRAQSGPHVHHRPHGHFGRNRQSRQARRSGRRDRRVRQVSECLGQDVVDPAEVVRALPVPRHDPASQARVRRLRSAPRVLGHRHHQLVRRFTYRQRITHFTETLDFLTEDDKDWVMGRAILARLNWA